MLRAFELTTTLALTGKSKTNLAQEVLGWEAMNEAGWKLILAGKPLGWEAHIGWEATIKIRAGKLTMAGKPNRAEGFMLSSQNPMVMSCFDVFGSLVCWGFLRDAKA